MLCTKPSGFDELITCMLDTIHPPRCIHLCGLSYNSTSEYCSSQRKRDSKPQQQGRGGTGAWRWRGRSTSCAFVRRCASIRLPSKLLVQPSLTTLLLTQSIPQRLSLEPSHPAASRHHVSHSAEPHGGSCRYAANLTNTHGTT
jgi:hypothetical protein